MLKTVARGTVFARKSMTWGATLFAALALAFPISGCSEAITGTAGGAGSVDLGKAQEAAKTNPDIAKAAARRGGLGGSPIKSKAQ